MKAPPFEYHRPVTVDDTVALLAEYGDEAKVLAGGQSLAPLLNMRLARPAHVVDIGRLQPLAIIKHDDDGLRLGATVCQRRIERSELVRRINPLLADGVGFIGHVAIRTRGTIGGSLAHADPAAELPLLLVALDGAVDVRSTRGTRTIAARDLFAGFLTTSLDADELLTSVVVPPLGLGTGWSFTEFSRRSGDFAIVGVASTIRLDERGRCRQAGSRCQGSTPCRCGPCWPSRCSPAPIRPTIRGATSPKPHPPCSIRRPIFMAHRPIAPTWRACSSNVRSREAFGRSTAVPA